MFKRLGFRKVVSGSKWTASERDRRRRRANLNLGMDMEPLEARVLLATRIWDGGGGDAFWMTAANWQGDVAPVENDDLVFPDSASQLTNENNFPANTNFASLTIEAAGYELNGNAIDLDGAISTTYISSTSTLNAFLNLQGTQVFDIASGGELFLNGSITGTLGAGLTKTGGGTLTLGGANNVNTYDGLTTVSGGTLGLFKNGAINAIGGNLLIDGTANSATVLNRVFDQIPDTASVSLMGAGAVYTIEATRSETINGLTLDGGTVNIDGDYLDVGATGVTVQATQGLQSFITSGGGGDLRSDGVGLTFDVADTAVGADLEVTAPLGTATGMSKTGAGAMRLAPSISNSYNGSTHISDGALILAATGGAQIILNSLFVGDNAGGSALVTQEGDDQFADNADLFVRDDGFFNLGGNAETFNAIAIRGGTVSIGTGGVLTLVQTILNEATASNTTGQIQGPGTLDLNGESAFPIMLSDDAQTEVELRIGAVIQNGGINKSGTGTLALSGTNTYAGNTLVTGGILQVESDAALGAATTDYTEVSSGNAVFFVGDVSVAESFRINGQGVSGSGTLSARSGSATLTGHIGLYANSRVGAADGATLILNGEIDDVGDPFILTAGDSATGRVVLGGNNEFFNSSINVDAGYLRLTNSGALGDPMSFTSHSIGSAATLELAGDITIPAPKSFALDGLPVSGQSKIVNVSGDNTIQGDISLTSNNQAIDVADGTSLTLSGTISGSVDLDKNGPGTLVYTGVASMTGRVNVNSGTMLINGNVATASLVFVDGRLGGAGELPAVQVSPIGTVAPGNSPGMLQTQGFEMATGSVLEIELNGTLAGIEYDVVDVTGAVDLNSDMGAGATLSVSLGFTPTIGATFTIIFNDDMDPIEGTFADLPEGGSLIVGAYEFTITYQGGTDNNDVVLTYVGPATFTWDGGDVDDSLWSSPDNWVGNIAPAAGAILVFPDIAARKGNSNDFAAGTAFQSITIAGAGYLITGNAIQLSEGIEATLTTGNSEFGLDTELLATQTITVAAGGLLIHSGAISGTFGVTKAGEGGLQYGGASSNTYSGDTTVNEGQLTLAKTSGTAVAGNLIIGDGSGTGDEVRLNGSHQIADTSNVTLKSNALFDLFGFSDAIGALGMTGATVQSGVTGILTLGGDVTTNASSTTSTISGQLDLGGATRTFVVADGSAGTDLTVSAAISGTGAGIIKGGAASFMQISGNNTYDGTTTVSTGGLGAANANALGATSAGTVVSSGATLSLQGGNTFAAEPLTITGNGAGNLGALWNSSGTNTWTGAITLAGNSFLGAESAAPLTITAVIDDDAGSFSLTKVRSGSITLAAANTYDGGTTVSAGTLGASNSAALGSAAVTVISGATLALSGGISPTNALTIDGAGVGSNGALRSTSGVNTVSGTIGGATDATIGVDADTLTISGVIGGGARGISKVGAGLLELDGTNTYMGQSTVSAGTLQVDGTIVGNVAVSDGATLSGSGTISGPGITTSGAAILAPGTDGTPGALLYSGIPDVFLSSDATYKVDLDGATAGGLYDQLLITGIGTNFNAGSATLEVDLGYNPMLADTFAIVSKASALPIVGEFNGLAEGATFEETSPDGSIVTFTISYTMLGVTLTVTDVGPPTFTWDGGGGDNLWSTPANWVGDVAPIEGANLVFPDTGARLSNTNDFADGTAFSNITIAGAGYTLAGNRIDLTGDILAAYAAGTSTISAGLKLMVSATVDVASSGELDLSGPITSDDFSQDITKTGGGTLRFSGSVDNLFDDVFAHGGTVALAMSNNSNVNSSDLVIGDNTTAATVVFEADRQLWAGANVTVNEGSTLDLGVFDADISNLYLQGASVLIDDGGLLEIFIGVFSMAATNNVTSSITGAGSLGQSGSQFAFNVADDTDVAIDLSVDVVVAGSNTVSKTGAGTLRLTGENVYTGSTAVTAGTLSIASDNNLGTGAIELADGSTLAVTATTTIDNDIALTGNATISLANSPGLTLSGLISGSSALTASGGGDFALTNTGNEAAFSGSMTVSGSVHLQVSDDDALGSGALILSGGWLYLVGETTVDNTITLNSLTVIHVEPGITAGISGDIGESGGSRGFNKSGSGTLVLSGTNTYTGNTTLNGGVLSVASDANLGTGPVVLNNSSPTLRFTGAGPFDNEIQVSKPNGTIDFDADAVLSGLISGSSDLTITGPGVLNLTGTSTHTGSVTIASGTVLVNADLTTSSGVQVEAGAILGGTGTLPAIGSVGGTVAPGNSPGILSSGDVSFDASTAFDVELDGTTVGTEYDQLNVTGTVDLGGATLNINVGYAAQIGDFFVIVNNNDMEAITDTFAGLAEGATITVGAFVLTITYQGGTDGNDVVLTVTDASYTWSGAGSNTDWTNPDNWVGGVAPTPGSRLIFPDSPVTTESVNTFATDTVFYSITIEQSGYDISGNSIHLIEGITTTYTSDSSAFDLATTLTTDQTFDVETGGTLNFTGALAGGNVELTKAGGGNLSLSSTANEMGLTGGVIVNGGSVTVADDDALPDGQVTLADGTSLSVDGSTTIDNNIALNGLNVLIFVSSGHTVEVSGVILELISVRDLYKVGGGTLILSAANTYTGGSFVNAGTMALTGGFALSDGSAVTVADGATLELLTSETIGSLAGAGTVDLDALELTTGANDSSTTFSGVISGAGNLIKSGSGTFTLSGTNTYEGATNVNGGTLQVASDSNLGAGTVTLASSTALSITGATTIDNAITTTGPATISNSAEVTLSGLLTGTSALTLSGTQSLTLTNLGNSAAYTGDLTSVMSAPIVIPSDAALVGGSVYLGQATGRLLVTDDTTIDNNLILGWLGNGIEVADDVTVVYSGEISESSGPRNFFKTGNGTLILTGTSAYTGTTTVSAGMLRVNGSIESSTLVTVEDQAILSGTGLLSGLTANSGGTVAPGASPEVLTATDVDFNAGSTLDIELGGTIVGDEYDQLIASSSVTIDTSAILSVSFINGFIPLGGEEFVLINNTGVDPISGNFQDLPEGAVFEIDGANFRINYAGGDGNDLVITALAMPTIDVSSDNNPATFGTGIVFVAAISGSIGTPTGSATLVIDGIDQETVALGLLGQVTFSPVTGLAVGTYVVTVNYSGDEEYASGTGTLNGGQEVIAATTITTVTAAPNPSVYTQSVTFTITVTAQSGTPTGLVELFDGSTSLGMATLNGSGMAELDISTLTIGTHEITATYLGDGTYDPSTSETPVSQVVTQIGTTTSLGSSINPTVFGQPVTFTAVVSPMFGDLVPTGMVTFLDGTTVVGTAALNDQGVASFTTSALLVGGHTMTAQYQGSVEFTTSTSNLDVQAVSHAATALNVIPTETSAVVGETVEFQFEVTAVAPGAGTPSGLVEVLVNDVPTDVVPLDGQGAGSISIAMSAAGETIVSFRYLGNENFQASAGLVNSTVDVTAAATTTSLSASTNLTVVGQAVTLTATVTAVAPGSGVPSGIVTFLNGSTVLGTAMLVNGTATLTTSSLPYGLNSVTAEFEGSTNYDGSASNAVAVAVGVVLGDYDGDGKADLALYEYVPAFNSGRFDILLSAGGTMSRLMGTEGAIPVVGDFDGDGKSDMAVFNPNFGGDNAFWTIENSSNGQRQVIAFGAPNLVDIPAPADYDGDGVTDIATFRINSGQAPGAAEWFIRPSSDPAAGYVVVFGASGGMDVPVPADYDGDGKAEVATFRANSDLTPGAAEWFILPSDNPSGAYSVAFGAPDGIDVPVPADYDGDGKADIATFRTNSDINAASAQWFVLFSSNPGSAMMADLGTPGSVDAAGDYDGDGQADLAAFDRVLGQWRIRPIQSSSTTITTYGPRGPQVVPVLASIDNRLDTEEETEELQPAWFDEALEELDQIGSL